MPNKRRLNPLSTSPTHKLTEEERKDRQWAEAGVVYAAYGHAMFWVQALETELVRLISATQLVADIRSQSDADRVHTQVDSWTMGKVLNEAIERTSINRALRHRLRTALQRRNRLVHGYFHPRDNISIMGAGDRRRMLDELVNAQSFFKRATMAVAKLTNQEWAKTGAPVKELAIESDRIMEELIRKSEDEWW